MKKELIFVCFFFILCSQVQAQSFYSTYLSTSVSNTSNLYQNFSDVNDRLASVRGTVNLFPLHFGQITVFSEYTNYARNPNLSNITYGGSMTLLPLSDSSDFSLYSNFSYQGYSYKDAITTNSSNFSNKAIDAIATLGYKVSEKTNIRFGVNYKLTGFETNEVSDQKLAELFTGLNISLFGSNAFDIEAGFSQEKYDYLPEFRITGSDTMAYSVLPREAYSILKTADLNSFYLSFRYSRPLGNKTGFSLSYAFREFVDTKDSSMVYGYSTGYLSPWVSSYAGNSFQAKVKTYLVPFTIINLGVGYWNSSYLRTVETKELPGLINLFITNTANSELRYDDKYQVYLSFSFPIVNSSGRLFEPVLSINYVDNSSTISTYSFSDFAVTMSLNIL